MTARSTSFQKSKTLIPRLHLWEFHELAWLPDDLRVAITDILHFGWSYLPWPAAAPVGAATAIVERALHDSDSRAIVDLCSGSGGPVPGIVERLNSTATLPASERGGGVQATLTDLYPHEAEWRAAQQRFGEAHLGYEPQSVDATAVPPRLGGLRTLMGCFHHFQPPTATRILADAVASPQCGGIVVLELAQRQLLSTLLLTLVMFVLAFILPLFVSARSWKRLLLTFLLPIFPCIAAWDALVSSIRAYTVDELQLLANDADPQQRFRWSIHNHRVISWLPGFQITSVVGIRRPS